MKSEHYFWSAITAFTVAVSGASAEPTADYMVQEASGLMHYSCDSLVEATGSDEVEITETVEKMVAVSLVNRQINWNEYATTDEKAAELRSVFIEALRTGCDADRDALLAGVVDTAVKKAFGL